MESKVAVIGGTGDLGFGLALRWARAGVPVLIGSRDAAKARDAAGRARLILQEGILPGLAPGSSTEGARALTGAARTGFLPGLAQAISVEGLENGRAAAEASVVVLSVPFPAQVGILKSIRDSLKDAILVDTTVPLAATVGGRATRMVGVWQGSAAEQARELVPPSIPVLAAFHSLSAEALQDLSASLDCDVLVCGDDEPAKQTLFPLIQLIEGLRPVDAGPLEMARITEAMTALLISLNRRYRVQHSGVRITGI